MVTEIKLLPCPFCGGEAIVVKTESCGRYIGCWDCGGRTEEFETDYAGSAHDKAIAAWNRRSDAVPVVRGRWRTWEEQFPDRTTRKKNNLGVFCSACQLHADNMTSYCPNCGAKMEVEP